jgi:hypothetical protein
MVKDTNYIKIKKQGTNPAFRDKPIINQKPENIFCIRNSD